MEILGYVQEAIDKVPIEVMTNGTLIGLEEREQLIAEISFNAGEKAERERLIREGLLTEKQCIFKIHNALKANPDSVFPKLFEYIHEEEHKAGIREVVEWVYHNASFITDEQGRKWQAKLKEWGIKVPEH